MGDEISLLDFVLDLLRGTTASTTSIWSCRPPEEKAIGSDAGVGRGDQKPRVNAASGKDLELVADPGGGALYAPKISVQARDAIGRSWQMSTIQVDLMLLPQRFDLSYIGADGDKHRPVMIHRALFDPSSGSSPSCSGTTPGVPAWLAPVQAKVLPVADAHAAFAAGSPRSSGATGSAPRSSPPTETLGNRIRRAGRQRSRTCSSSATTTSLPQPSG